MTADNATSTSPAQAAAVLVKAIADPGKPLTVADASVASGLPLDDAEAGLHHLTAEYRGHLRVTEDGDLVHLFPHGFTKPWETKERLEAALGKLGRGLAGAARFLVRAWLLIVMVGYALLAVALLIALTFAGRSDRDDVGSAGAAVLGGLFRALADALFWTFHPFSPFYLGHRADPIRGRRGAWGREPEEPKVPLYEKVNRFVFGPTQPTPDPFAERAAILREIRRGKGRIGLGDVMRVTGLPREKADPLMARLMLEHDGSVEVGDQGGIVYRFEALRRTAAEVRPGREAPLPWPSAPELPPLTGNSVPANLAIAALNGFNALAAGLVIQHGLTLENIARLLAPRDPRVPLVLPYDGVPIALGVVPLVFSIGVLALPLFRAVARPRKERRLAKERARLSVMREVLTHTGKGELVTDEALRAAYRVATGDEPSSKEITRQVVDLGGDVDVGPEGEVRYRFADLEAETEALEEERAQADEREARLGAVVFTSEDE